MSRGRQPMFADPPGEKWCRGCGVLKSLGEYHRSPHLKDGRRPRCKACENPLAVERMRGVHRGKRRGRYRGGRQSGYHPKGNYIHLHEMMEKVGNVGNVGETGYRRGVGEASYLYTGGPGGRVGHSVVKGTDIVGLLPLKYRGWVRPLVLRLVERAWREGRLVDKTVDGQMRTAIVMADGTVVAARDSAKVLAAWLRAIKLRPQNGEFTERKGLTGLL